MKTNPNYLTALFITEHHDSWPDPSGPWAISDAGAQGPFQFMPGTWDGYKTDGDNDGKTDIQNLADSAFSAANMLARNGIGPSAPLGNLDKPFFKGTFTRFSGEYNAGGGAIDRLTNGDENAPLSIIKNYSSGQTYEYIINTYAVVSSSFTKGAPGWGDLSSSSSSATTASTTPSSIGCACTTSTASSPGTGRPIIVLDPGHSGVDRTITDPRTGLDDHDYPNQPEMEDVFDVAQQIKTKLEQDGYRVIMTKNSSADTVSLRQRADIANGNNAALAVSIHDQAGSSGGLAFSAFHEIYAQKVGEYREKPDGSNKTVFTNADIAAKSQLYSLNFQKARAAAEGIEPTIKENSFDNRSGIDPGNLSLVQLFANAPWIYNEVGGNSDGQIGLSQTDKAKYAAGLIAGIEQSIPATGGSTVASGNSCSGSALSNAIVHTALNLSWPGPHNPPLEAKPEYLAALKEFNPSVSNVGADCGVFVATVMHASGADKDYPASGTATQEEYVRHSEKYDVRQLSPTDTTDVFQSGDILIVNQGSGQGGDGHTMIFTGRSSTGDFNEASASLGSRMPSLGIVNSVADPSDRGYYVLARLR